MNRKKLYQKLNLRDLFLTTMSSVQKRVTSETKSTVHTIESSYIWEIKHPEDIHQTLQSKETTIPLLKIVW